MDNVLGQLFSVASAAWAFVCINAVALFKAWPAIMERLNERRRDAHSEKSADWERLRGEINRLDGRCDHLQREVDECHRERAEWMTRAISAEAYQLGQGEARQEAANILAAERIAEANKKEPGNGD